MNREDVKKLAELLTILTNSSADYSVYEKDENTLVRELNAKMGNIEEFLDPQIAGAPPAEGFDLIFADTCVLILRRAVEVFIKPALAEAEKFLAEHDKDYSENENVTLQFQEQMQDEQRQVASMMVKYGGGFVRPLGQVLYRADDGNALTIKSAWPELWKQFMVYYKKDVEAAKNKLSDTLIERAKK